MERGREDRIEWVGSTLWHLLSIHCLPSCTFSEVSCGDDTRRLAVTFPAEATSEQRFAYRNGVSQRLGSPSREFSVNLFWQLTAH